MQRAFVIRCTLGLSSRRSFSQSAACRNSSRPATAPKQIPDLKLIKEHPEQYATNATLRNYAHHVSSPQAIVELSAKISAINKTLVAPRKDLKDSEKRLGQLKAARDDEAAKSVYEHILTLRAQVDDASKEIERLSEQSLQLALALPNLTSSQTPTNNEPKVLRYLNYDPQNPPRYDPSADHSIIGQELGILDFASASTTTGWGFYYLLNDAAWLEQALVQYATSVARKYGWQLATPPSLVYSHIADSCGFQPRDASDEQQIWQIAQPQKDADKPSRSLAATAEIPLAALYAEKNIEAAKLPLKLVGSSRCYRAEAGSRGVDTKGLYRVHEFTKVEMFAWTDAPAVNSGEEADWTQHSTVVFDEMVKIQIEILSALGLPCRVLEMPASDMGASAFRKIDIEAQFPSRQSRDEGWGELTSASICTDYQSRRLNTRILEKSGARSRFPHTINGTAIAIPRVLACILENHWDPTTHVVNIPAVLQSFMGGQKTIGPSSSLGTK